VQQHPRLQGRTAVGMVLEGLAPAGAAEHTVTLPVDFTAQAGPGAPSCSCAP
jgi:LacI family repressor for deo operon, udp, cdd, tsx, nupC, and nupG